MYQEAMGAEADCLEAIYNLGVVNKRLGEHPTGAWRDIGTRSGSGSWGRCREIANGVLRTLWCSP